ncbi:hypothetical protein D3C84_676120 [compost metagenome]
MLGVHQHVHGHLLAKLGQGAADFKIAQVRPHQHLSALGAQLAAQLPGVDDLDLLQAQLAVPYVELVQQGIGEGHELAEHPRVAGAQAGLPAPVGQALLVLPDTLPGTAAKHEEVQDDAIQHRAEQAPTEQLDAQGGQLHQPEAATFLVFGPVLFAVAHACHRRQRMAGARSNMPKNSLVCIFEINALSWNRRKCERPSAG